MSEQELEIVPACTPEVQPATLQLEPNGVLLGALVGFAADGRPLVAYPGNPSQAGTPANATVALREDHIGRRVALLFENGDLQRPLIMGLLQTFQERQSPPATNKTASQPATAELDGERLVLSAEHEIVLQCGRASITLTKAGKIILRGAYLLSRSSGLNKIKGATVHVN